MKDPYYVCVLCYEYMAPDKATQHMLDHFSRPYFCHNCDIPGRHCDIDHSADSQTESVEGTYALKWIEKFVTQQKHFKNTPLKCPRQIAKSDLCPLCDITNVQHSYPGNPQNFHADMTSHVRKTILDHRHSETSSPSVIPESLRAHIYRHLNYLAYVCVDCVKSPAKFLLSEMLKHIKCEHGNIRDNVEAYIRVRVVQITKLESYLRFYMKRHANIVWSSETKEFDDWCKQQSIALPNRTLVDNSARDRPIRKSPTEPRAESPCLDDVEVDEPKRLRAKSPKHKTEVKASATKQRTELSAEGSRSKTSTPANGYTEVKVIKKLVIEPESSTVIRAAVQRATGHSIDNKTPPRVEQAAEDRINSLLECYKRFKLNCCSLKLTRLTEAEIKSYQTKCRVAPASSDHSDTASTDSEKISLSSYSSPEDNGYVPYRCAFCATKFLSRERAENCLRDHLKYCPISCTACNEVFSDVDGFAKHIKNQPHFDIFDSPTYRVALEESYERWIQPYLDYQEKEFNSAIPSTTADKLCPVCHNLGGKGRTRCDEHTFTHLQYKPFVCKLCKENGKQFALSWVDGDGKAKVHLRQAHEKAASSLGELMEYFPKLGKLGYLEKFLEDFSVNNELIGMVTCMDGPSTSQGGVSGSSDSKEKKRRRRQQKNYNRALAPKKPKHSPVAQARKHEDKSSTERAVISSNQRVVVIKSVPSATVPVILPQTNTDSSLAPKCSDVSQNEEAEKKFPCLFCSESFATKEETFAHYSREIGFKWLFCPEDECKLEFHSVADIESHQDITGHEGTRVEKTVEYMWLCNFVQSLDRQMKSGKSDCQNVEACPVCAIIGASGERTNMEAEVRRFHIREHLRYIKKKCAFCAYLPSSVEDMRHHLYSHKNIGHSDEFDKCWIDHQFQKLDEFIERSVRTDAVTDYMYEALLQQEREDGQEEENGAGD